MEDVRDRGFQLWIVTSGDRLRIHRDLDVRRNTDALHAPFAKAHHAAPRNTHVATVEHRHDAGVADGDAVGPRPDAGIAKKTTTVDVTSRWRGFRTVSTLWREKTNANNYKNDDVDS